MTRIDLRPVDRRAYSGDMTTPTASLTDLTPPQVDEILFPLLATRYTLSEGIIDARHTLAKTVWPTEYKERFEKYYGRFDSKVYPLDFRFDSGRAVIRQVERLNNLVAQLAEIQAQIAPLEAEYDRRPWNRFLLVGGGHIHVPHKCGSIRPTTRAGWIIDASGFEADEVVRKYDYTACTKCFPDAPVNEPVADPAICTAGPYDHTQAQSGNRYSTCNACKYFGAVTQYGKLRKHKKPVK